MSLIESSYVIHAASSHETWIQEMYKVMKENIGLFEKNEIYYFDKNCSGVGIYLSEDSSGINFNVTNGQKTSTAKNIGINVSNNNEIYFQWGKNNEAYYMLFSENVNSFSALVAGKTDQGNWGVLFMNTVFLSKNMFNMTLEATVSNTAPFSIIKMPTSQADENFTSIYKVLSAPMFDKHGTLIYDGEKIYRVVSIGAKASNPCIAFEVSDD